MSYYLTTARYDKKLDNGTFKRVNEKYLCDALSITEAVAITTEDLSPYAADLEVIKVERTPISEVVGDKEGGKFFIAKVSLLRIDERTAEEKKTRLQWLIGADDYDTAKSTLTGEISKFMADIEIAGLAESPILGYLTHE